MSTKKMLHRSLALLLALVMTLGLVPQQALAYLAERPEELTIVDKDGNTVAVTEDWETAFPYGTFAFSDFQMVAEEGGNTAVIKVYRLGGTQGRAVAYVTYEPALTRLEDGSASYSTAAGSNDIIIEVENPLPGAENQPIGQPEPPRQPEQPVKVVSTAAETDVILSIDVEAESYQWYVLYGGSWELVDGAVDKDFVVAQEELEGYDFRCVYTVDGEEYCSDSYLGVAYTVATEEEPAPAEDGELDLLVDLNTEPTYTRITPENAEDPYSGYIFNMTFADGEWVKEIRITVPEDEEPEALKFGTFTIVDNDGASLYDTANTLTLRVEDNDKAEASTLGFAVTEVRADKAAGTAELTVVRTGGNQTMVTIDYATVDGTAVAGTDYAATSGTLVFYADRNQQVIEVPLIDDGVATEEERTFQVVLSNLKGDGDGLCTLEGTEAVVSLYNSGESTGEQNLATYLYQSDVTDLSGTVTEAESALAPVGGGAVTGQQVENEGEVLTARIGGEDGDVSTLSYNYPNKLTFSNGGWNLYEDIPSSGWEGGQSYDGGIWTYRSKGAGSATLTFDPRLYCGISANFNWTCSLASGWTLTLYGMEYTYPWAKLLTADGSQWARTDSRVKDNGSYFTPSISWTKSTGIYSSWSIADNVNRLQLGTSRHDAHDSENNAEANLKSGTLERRTFGGDFYLQIHTANDSGEGSGNTQTAPDGAASLTESSGVYDSMKPVITIQSGQGGVSNGKLFVGTTLQVTLQNTASYTPATSDSSLSYAVYLTRDGQVVPANITNSGNTYYIQLLWNGMTDEQVNSGDYTVNVVMTRKQNLVLDISPSVPRLTDENGNITANIDTNKITDAVNDFWASTNGGITYGYSDEQTSGDTITYEQKTGTLTSSSGFNQSSAVLTKADLTNVQWINFNLPAEDKIVYNGRTYNGNEKIWLSVSDLATSNMTFYYYDSAYLSAVSVMTATISEVELFLDMSGNGMIDGYYNTETGYFIVDENSEDISLGFLDPGMSYNELYFQPVKLENGKYAQYFMKVYYTMNPRSLIPDEGTDTSAVAQVLPAFVSTITEGNSYELLTEEQKAYRYLISGKTKIGADGELFRSSDNHVMYGPEASARSMVDVPLGGDISPAKLNDDGTAYTWTPNYQGNLLYPFENPEPIIIEESLAGRNIPIAEIKGYENGQVVLEEGGADKLNGYLGSLTANNTVALAVQEQKATTEEIAAANGVTIGGGDVVLQSEGSAEGTLAPESVTTTDSKITPDARYLQEMGSGNAATQAGVDMNHMEGVDFPYPELNQDFALDLPSTELGVTDFAGIVMDGDTVGFTIGIPMGGWNSNGDAGAGGAGGGGSNYGTNPGEAIKSSGETIANIFKWMRSPRAMAQEVDDSYKATKDKQNWYNQKMGQGEGVTAKEFKAEFSISAAFMFKYDPVTNHYEFSQFAMAVGVELAFTYKARFTSCPIIYLYITVHLDIEFSASVDVERETVETGSNLVTTTMVDPESNRGYVNLTKGDAVVLSQTQYKALNLDFDGKVLLEVYTDAGCTQELSGFRKGYLSSTGDDDVLVVLKQTSSATMGQDVYLRLTALEDTRLYEAMAVETSQNKTSISGFEVAPELYVQVGAGVGIEILKAEIYFKLSIGCTMAFANPTGNGTREDFRLKTFDFGAAIGINVQLLMFSYELELIGIYINYDYEGDPRWTYTWSALNGAYGGEGDLKTLSEDGGSTGVKVSLPGSSAGTQTIYSPSAGSDLDPLAYDPSDKAVPFQLSGYNSSGDAFKLADGLASGYEYRVVTVGEENYLLYTVSRSDAAHPVDNSMLVLSRIKLTSAGGKDSYGLVNPVDEDDPTPYIIVDDDKTGDLEFTGWADGDTLRIAWVSYATETEEVPAALDKPEGDAPGGMDQSNYQQVYEDFVKTEPMAVEDPGAAPVAPVQADYFVTKAEYDGLEDTVKKNYTQDTTDTGYYYNNNYISYANAKAAYDAAQSAYTTEKGEYDAKKAAYEKYLDDKAAYDVQHAEYKRWYDYFKSVADENAANQAVANAAAKNTVVKTASFKTGSPADIADAAAVNTKGSHVYLPGGSDDGSVIIYAQAQHYTDTTSLEKDYKAYLESFYPDTMGSGAASIREYRLTYQKGLWDAYGERTELHAVVNGQEVTTVPATQSGEILDNMEITEINGTYYVVYTTSQQTYINADGNTTTTVGDATDLLTTRRLYLQTLTADGDPTWGEALLLRTLVDYDRNTVTDGVYQGGSLTAYQDPYFSDLQFLNGKLGGLTGTDEKFDVVTLADDTQEFLLFEMNGSTYVIPQADLESIAGETHTGSIIPFFQPEKQTGADGNEVTSNTTGRSQVTIGADGAGNISAVYTANVNGTTNNALYLAKWDPKSQTWGAGTMLAMNYMQVYEDAAASDWSASETEQAYLGQLDGYQGGGMDQFVFSDLQIALGQKKTDTGTTTSDGEQTVQANEDGAQSQDTLLVLTSGVTTYLKEYTYTDENNQQQTVLIPQSDEEAQKAYADGTQTKKPGTGIYAISYGVGQQELGNATLTFGEYDFTAGSRLEAIGSFQNIGDVGIRGSEANPITVKLMLKTSESADPVALATWEITENITAGQTVKLAGTCDALTQDLPKGSTFYFTVSEDADYTTDAFSGSTDPVLTVEEKPELGFEHLSISSASVDAGGNTVLDVNFQVGNRGSKTAEDVYVQFSYESGRDENNNPVYTPLDITNNTLTVSKQEELETLADNPDAQNGILRLSNTEDGSNIDTNKGRTVSGTITVPPSVYQGAETGSLSLRVEIFSSADTSMTYGADGLITADHGEYNTGNNTWLTAVEHKTYFDTADKITLAMGNTMRLPVSIATSTGKDPTIQVTEVPDTQGGAKNLGVLYYQQTANSGTGNTQGVLVVTPSREGTGVLEIKDQATNTIHSIAYEVTAAGEGINVFRDNGLFTFYNADSTEYDETAAAGTQDWSFNGDITTWGTGSGATRPYLSNLANGKVGAYFTFDTVAESIDFSFNGKIRVSSTYPGFRAVEITCAGGSEKAAVHFGDLGQTHTVTVTVLDNGDSNPTADFDTIVEHFVGNKPPVPSSDATSPHIYWNRSFPDTASLETGSGNVKLKLYVLDDNGLATLTVNGVTPTISERGDNYWEADVTVSENGTLKVEAMDTASNRTTQTITVDWFNTTVTSGTVSTAPDVSADFYKNNSQTPMGTSDYVTDDDTVVAKASSATAGVTFSAQRITIRKTDEGTTELETATLLPNEGTADAFDAKANGFYLVKATAADGSWSQVILEMTRVDNDLPTASLNTTTALDGTVSLSWSITKGDPTLSPITAAAINGYNVFTNEMIGRTGVGGSLEIKYGGSYALTGTDAAGHTATHNITVDGLPIQAGENAVTVVHAWNQERNNGVITVDSTGFTGGIYDAEKSTPASNGYAGSYEALLTPAEDIFDAEAVRQELLDAYAKDYFEQNPDAEPDDPNAVMPEDELNAALEEREKAAWEAWEAEAMAEDNDSSWTELTGSNSFESLEPGDYILLIRDANDKRNENVTIQRTLTVNDEAIVMAAESEPEHNGGRDGSITVEAKYGRLNYGTYQFIVRPVEIPEGKEEPELMDVRKLTEALDPELYPAEDGWTTPVWQTSDLAAGSLSTSIFSGLHSGWYQVAVRAMEGVTAAEMQTLIELYQTYLAARARVEAAEAGLTESGLNNAAAAKAQRINEALQVWQIASEEEKNDAWNQYLALINSDSNIQTLLKAWADASYEDGAEKEAYDGAVADFTRQQAEAEAEEEKTAADTALTTAENAYTTKKTELESKSEAAYTADDSLWDNAATMLIEVEAENSYVSPLIQVSDLRYDRENNLVKVHFLSYKKELSDAAEKQLIQDNATMDILAYSNKMEALIPVGTLSEGDDLMAMLMPFPDLPQDGEYLVQYTDGSGVTHPVAWSLVTPGKVYYLAAEAGAYAIAAADEAFSDVPEDFWGEEAVTFAAARGLFQGVGDGRFDPNGTMTRSMLVTVLGRLAGIDPADYSGENAFSDVDPDAWYGPYVAWAAATGVVQGVGGDRFAPEDPITREQLCTMLARYLDSDGIELPELANPAAFTDEDQVSDWAKAAVERFRQLGIVEGSDTGAFLPKNNASRAEVAAVFQRLITTILTNI